MSCGYQGYEFGAHYLDSICIDGKLWDADSGDGDMLDHGGDIPCPNCQRKAWMAYHRDEIMELGVEQGYEGQEAQAVKYGGFSEAIFHNIDAMRTIRRWNKRGWYRGQKEKRKDERQHYS